MYSLVRCIALARTVGAQWKEEDLADIYVFNIYGAYRGVYIVVTHPSIGDGETELYVNMDDIRSEYSSFTGTLAELMVYNGNKTLPTVEALPNTNYKYCRYSDAFQVGYIVDLAIVGEVPPPNYPRSEYNDLSIIRPRYKTDMTLIHNYCLTTVNGFLHRTDAESDGSKAYIIDGGRTFRHQRDNQVGILSFKDIGRVTKIPITDEMIHTVDDNTLLYDRTQLVLTDIDITNKTVLLSVGGYLLLPDDTSFFQNGDQAFIVDLSQLPFLERFYESSHYLDLSSLGLGESIINPSLVNVEELTSDAVIRKYYQLPQSFIIVIDTPNLYSRKLYLNSPVLPGEFISFIQPTYPLMVGYGKMAEYFSSQEDLQWHLSVKDSFYRNFVLTYSHPDEMVDVVDHKVPMSPYYHSKGFFLEMYSTTEL